MPKLTNDTSFSQAIGGTNYTFSGATIDSLGATEYSLGVIVVDVSGSTAPFRSTMEQVLKETVAAVSDPKKNPRVDNMMLRVVLFDNVVRELHGFKPLRDCNPSDYDGCLGTGGGTTALYDALYTSVQSVVQYGQHLNENEYDVNAIVYVITDGQEYPRNASKATRNMVKGAIDGAVTGEALESLASVLIGIGPDQAYFKDLAAECGILEYIGLNDANRDTLAKLGGYMSRTFSSTSQVFGTGGPSQSLSF